MPLIIEDSKVAVQAVGYARVSTEDQNLDRQLEALKAAGVKRIYSEKVSGKSAAGRAELQACLDYVREGDTLIVCSMDRLARSLSDLLSIVHGLAAKKVTVRFLKESLAFDGSAQADFLLGIFGSVAQFERALIKERQAEGIAVARRAGKYKGRKPKLSEDQKVAVRDLHAEGVGVSEIARRFNATRPLIYRVLNAGKAPKAEKQAEQELVAEKKTA